MGYVTKTYLFQNLWGAKVRIGKNVSIRNSHIIVTPGSCLEICDNVKINNVIISIDKGVCHISEWSIIGDVVNKVMLNIEEGEVHLGHHSKISARRIWIRFGGCLHIGAYTNINADSEIRCDEKITIGDYNQISYHVNIWDTNTHSILSKEERRQITEQYYPYFGKELSRPKTSPISISDDCWIGQNATLLKGTHLGKGVIVGYNTVLSAKCIPDNTTVITDIKLIEI